MESNILEKVKEYALKNIDNIYIVDVFSDEIKIYDENNNLNLVKTDSLTSYLENTKLNIQSEYLSSYMNMFSIPKLEEAIKEGKDNLALRYKLSNGSITNIISFLTEINGKKIIIALEYASNSSEFTNNNIKYNSLVEAVSDSILKINNVFNVKEKTDVKKIEEYINSILYGLANNYKELKSNLTKDAANISSLGGDTILIVDDDSLTRNMIKKIFDNEYNIKMAANGKEAIDYFEEMNNKSVMEKKDNVLGIFLDLTMPVMDGFSVLEYLSKNNYLSKVPVIIISGDYEKETKTKVYSYNIADMLEKPFDFEVVKHRINNFINLYKSSNSLNDLINNQNSNLKEIINPLVDAYQLDYSKNINLVNKYINIIGNKVMEDFSNYNLTAEKIGKMADASMYYDIGFYSIPKTLLSKKNFDNEELENIKKYPLYGAKMIDYIYDLTSDEVYKKYAYNIAKHYHENYDGTGYPSKLKGEEIPIEAQISAIAIMYFNLKKKDIPNIKDKIVSKQGIMFNPKIIGSFIKVEEELKNINF